MLNHKPPNTFIYLINIARKLPKISSNIPRSGIYVARLSAFLGTDVKASHELPIFRRSLMAAPLACIAIITLFSTDIDGEKCRTSTIFFLPFYEKYSCFIYACLFSTTNDQIRQIPANIVSINESLYFS